MDDTNPFEGFYKKAKQIFGGGMFDRLPTSLVTLGALKQTRPEMAKQIFVEGFLAPLRNMLEERSSPKLQSLLEELESRFLQEEIVEIRIELESVLVSELIVLGYEFWSKESGSELLNDDGSLTISGRFVRDMIRDQVATQLALYFVSCERFVALLFAAALTGTEALEEQLALHREAHRPGIIESIMSHVLAGSDMEPGTAAFARLSESIKDASDAQLMKIYHALQGTWFNSHDAIERLVDDAIGVTPETEF